MAKSGGQTSADAVLASPNSTPSIRVRAVDTKQRCGVYWSPYPMFQRGLCGPQHHGHRGASSLQDQAVRVHPLRLWWVRPPRRSPRPRQTLRGNEVERGIKCKRLKNPPASPPPAAPLLLKAPRHRRARLRPVAVAPDSAAPCAPRAVMNAQPLPYPAVPSPSA